jgi:preprotein translocase subunit SecF
VVGFDNTLEEKELNSLKNEFRDQVLTSLKTTGENIVETKYTNIGKSFGDYIKNTAILTLIIAIIAIALYITWAFSGVVSGINYISFSSITIITLFHDIVIAT